MAGGSSAGIISNNSQVGADVIKTDNVKDGELKNADIAADAAIARSKLADVSTESRVIGRKTAGAGADEELTLSEILDFIGSATKGDILVRDTSGWARLAAGAAGYILTANGAAALPSYQAGAAPKIATGYTDVVVTSNNTEQTLVSQAIAGGILGTSNAIRLKAVIALDWSGNGSYAQIKVKYGSTILANQTFDPAGTPTQTATIMLETILIAAGATSAQETNTLMHGVGLADTATLANWLRVDTGTAAIDSTASQNLVITVTWQNASSSLTATLKHFIIERIS